MNNSAMVNVSVIMWRSVFVIVLVYGSIWTGSPRVHAEERKGSAGVINGMRIGVLAHDVDHLWSGSHVEDGMDVNVELLFNEPNAALWKGCILTNVGASLNTAGNTSKIYGGLLWEFSTAGGLFLNTGLGLALHNGKTDTASADRKSLGSHLLFRIPIEFGLTFGGRHRISVLFDHMSNAYLADPNQGLDTLGIRYGIQF